MNRNHYAFSVSYIRAIENKLLSKADIENLLLAKTPEEAIRVLLDKGYGSEMVEPADFEALLSEQTNACWEAVREVAPDEKLLDILLYRNDFHNIQVCLKAIGRGRKDYEAFAVSPYTVDPGQIWDCTLKGDFSELPEKMAIPAAKSYDVITRTADAQVSDMILDKAAMDYTLEQAKLWYPSSMKKALPA